jgi:hypothetical protein
MKFNRNYPSWQSVLLMEEAGVPRGNNRLLTFMVTIAKVAILKISNSLEWVLTS